MIKRKILNKLLYLSKKFPVVTLTGPRQSGKTTLVKSAFPQKKYFSLEDPDIRSYAASDPRGFLSDCKNGAIIDEIQRVPDLFSYIQTVVDNKRQNGFFILTGSQNYLLQENVSQTLAGRTAILTLLPFSTEELELTKYASKSSAKYIYTGFYPRIYDRKIKPSDWYPNYIQTYIERDIRMIKNISDLNTFQKFLKICAGRTGQLINLSSIASDCGITHNTVKAWLSILESSYIIFFLKPYHENFNKRLVKMHKMYFYDTGLACFLLGIKDKKQLETHYLKGGIFESFVMSEIFKHKTNRGLDPDCYFWRDKNGNEIDCLLESGNNIVPIEIKAGKTFNEDYLSGINYWNKIANKKNNQKSYIIYNGEQKQERKEFVIINWQDIHDTLNKL